MFQATIRNLSLSASSVWMAVVGWGDSWMKQSSYPWLNSRGSCQLCWVAGIPLHPDSHYDCVCVHSCCTLLFHSTRVEVRGELVGVGSPFLPRRLQGLNSGCQLWWQVPFLSPTEPSHKLILCILNQSLSLSRSICLLGEWGWPASLPWASSGLHLPSTGISGMYHHPT